MMLKFGSRANVVCEDVFEHMVRPCAWFHLPSSSEFTHIQMQHEPRFVGICR
jgi:hypothetical protein